MKTLVLYAHPAQQHSKVNSALAEAAKATNGISVVDLYAKYPRLDIDVEVEQQRLLDHDAIIFQFPLMWYSTPPMLKEWQDLVLEYGFAYGEGGDNLSGKLWMNSVSAGSPENAYGPDGHNKFELRTLLSPLEATSNLCHMTYIPPFALFSALSAPNSGDLETHVAGYTKLLEAFRDDKLDIKAARALPLLNGNNIPTLKKGDKA